MKQLINKRMRISAGVVMISVMVIACDKEDSEKQPRIFSANGDINAAVTEFRNLLGPLNNSTGMTTGRREINWDGVPDSLDGKKLPNDFFNPVGANAQVTLQRGVLYAGTSDAMVSQTKFAEVNANASGGFSTFSGNKGFAVVNSIEWPVTFERAGQHTPATVQGFGAVFSDVDKDNSTFIEFFNDNTSLGRFYVKAHDNTTGFSFLAVHFEDKLVTSVKIGHEGKLTDGENDITQGGIKDLVILDDFIYSEPLLR
jgi:hypothetical protein